MTTKRGDETVSGADYTEEDWDAVDSPEMTDEELAGLRPAEAVLPPGMIATLRRTRGQQRAPTKKLISLRVDQRVLDHYRSTGAGWQARMNEALLKAAGLN